MNHNPKTNGKLFHYIAGYTPLLTQTKFMDFSFYWRYKKEMNMKGKKGYD